MRLAKKHWLVYLAYLPERIMKSPIDIPAQTSLCSLIGKAFISTPLFIAVGLPVATVIACAIGVLCLPMIIWDWKLKSRWDKSVIKASILDFKNKTCTKVEIE